MLGGRVVYFPHGTVGLPEKDDPVRLLARVIYFDNVSKVYNEYSTALREITLEIAQGEFVSIVGHSGAGKSTLLKLLLAEETPTEGQVYFHSVNIHQIPPRNLMEYRRKIGMVFQDFRLLPHKTAYENIAFAMEAAGRSDEEIAEDVPYVLDLVDLADKMWHFPHELSGGEKQRVAIARALVNQPEILVADEPTGNLDPVNTHEVARILMRVNDLGTTVLLTTHNPSVVEMIGRRVVTMDRGRIVRDSPQEARQTIAAAS
ncbi:MAG: ABC transporter ATP-binding protein [Candidatus Parcubacteria bacterium]|nr:MAG: ABC transporter ATP-binding protein [Candidatus Parcubacteria bacterium]